MFGIILVVLVVLLIYLKIIKPHNYWTDRGVKQRSQTYILGDSAGFILRKESFFESVQKVYTAFPEERYHGMYQMLSPTLVLRDPDLIKQIAVKDFDHFLDHRSFIPDGVDELWSRNLFALKGNRWRDMRSTMSPSFTTSKMKTIFNLVSECAKEFNKYFLDSAKDVMPVELKDTCTRYSNDVIATVAFGVKCDSLREPQNEFYVMGKEATTFTGLWKNMKFFLFLAIPNVCKVLGLTLFNKQLNEFFKRIIKETIAMREEKGTVRPDMLHLLMEARKGRVKPEEDGKLVDAGFATVEESSDLTSNAKLARIEITDLDITAQALVFFFGGFESVSTLMCFMGHELAVNPDIQLKLQREVDETLEECRGTLTYEALLKMKYMDMVISETLRKWPVNIITDRICTERYTIQPTRTNERPIDLEKGDIVWIPISGLQWDPQYFPEPERFDPERFSDENKDNIKPYTYLPFGVGPRNCIGSRFALMETKTIFFHLLSNFDLVPVEKTQVPLKLSKKSFTLLAEKGFWIGLKLRNVVK